MPARHRPSPHRKRPVGLTTTEHVANDVYKLERTAATTSTRVVGWAKVVLAGMFGGVSAPQLYTYRVYDRASGHVALQFDDDDTGTDYLTMVRNDLDHMSPRQFAAKWSLELPQD